MNKNQKRKRIKSIRNSAIILLTLTLGLIGNHLYIKANYSTANATVISSQREVVGINMRPKMNENIWGTHLIVEFESEGIIIESHALLQSFPQYRTGEKVKVRFNKRKPEKCFLINY